jgi:hypothetical protein
MIGSCDSTGIIAVQHDYTMTRILLKPLHKGNAASHLSPVNIMDLSPRIYYGATTTLPYRK